MLGAITGDIIGSRFEFNSIKSTSFDLFGRGCRYTDDSVMTMAVAEWLLDDPNYSHAILEQKLVRYGELDPNAGYGGKFYDWLFNPNQLWPDGIRRPYNSWGNGSAMRVSAVGWMFETIEETECVAEISASITHNHPEGIKGAQAIAAAIFMARKGASKDEMRDYVSNKFQYDLNRTIEQIRPEYDFEVSCQKSVPEAVIAFLDSVDYESAVRLAVSLGGDADTQACIAGGIAEAYYGMPDDLVEDVGYHLIPTYKNNIIRLSENSAYHCRREQLRRCWRR